MKKAASPMTATLILLIFALALGFFIVNIQTYTEESNDICTDIGKVKIAVKNTEPIICKQQFNQTHSLLKTQISNNAEKPIFGFHFTFIGNSGAPIYIHRDYNTTLLPYGGISKIFYYPNSIGILQQVKISSYRKLGADLYLCSKTPIVISEVPDCK